MAVNGEQNQQFNQNANEKEQAPSTGGGAADNSGGAAVPTAGSRVATSSNGQQAGSTGSGRFTNLQKYIGANQGAGDRLGAGITSKVSRENEGASKEANTSASAVKDGIASAQNKLQTGNQYKSQVDSDNFNAKDLAGDNNKLQDFTQYRTGSAIDEAQLAKQNQAAQTNYMNLQNQMQTQLGQTQSDNGRFNMLKNTFGGGSVYQNPYSQGQQRLDGLLLQSGGGNQIGQLQNQLRTGVSAAGQQLGQLDAAGKTIGDIKSQESALASGLQSGIDAKTGKFVGDIEATQGAVNAQRTADQDWANKQYAGLQGGQAVDKKFADMLGLTSGQNIYNTLSGKNANAYFNYGATNLTGANQLANQNQRSYYDSLAKLSGIDPGAYAITDSGAPESAVSVNSNANLLKDVDATGKGFAARSYSQRGGGSEGSKIENVLSGQNLMDTINKVGLDASKAAVSRYQNTAYTWDQGDSAMAQLVNDAAAKSRISNGLGGLDNSSGYVSGIGQYNASLALRDLLNSGYFNAVNVKPGEDVESGGQFDVK